MAQSVLLIFCSSGDKRSSINTLPPLGVLSIAAFLEERGIHTDVIDNSINPEARFDPEKYDVIGFSINISNLRSALQMLSDIKNKSPEIHIVVGGPLCMSNPELFFQSSFIDAVFTGEGEEALFEYLTSENKENVKGIYIRQGSDYYFTGARKWINDLDSLPIPAFNKVDMNRYNNFPKRRRPISSIMTSRGCPFSCIFCSHAMGRKWRSRSPENVVREIKYQVNEFGVKEICIYDDNFSLNKQRAEMICDLLIEDSIPVTLQFSNGLRVDSLDASLLAKLKEAGTWLIGLAPETGNPEVMKKIRKGFDHSQVLNIRRECKKIGIKTFGFFMIGFPFEDKGSIEDTIRFAKELDCEIVEFNKVVPYANTELYEMIIDGGYLLNNSPSEVQSYHEGSIFTHKVGDLSPYELKDLIVQAYRQYYLRLPKMIDLLKTFSIEDLWGLTYYALSTRNI
jgi:radical SAM superfamily enzyme YgiQ (UPF0313 family)